MNVFYYMINIEQTSKSRRIYAYAPIFLFIHSITYSLVHLLNHSLTYSLTNMVNHSITCFSLIYLSTYSLMLHVFTYFSIY